jgi:hypothetical protein
MSDGKNAGNEQAHDYVQVYLAGNLVEAEFFKGMLEANDIPALIEGEASERAVAKLRALVADAPADVVKATAN